MNRFLALFAFATLSCNCAAQRHTMVKTTFVGDGRPHPEMACIFSNDSGGLEATCISLQELAKRLQQDDEREEKENRWKL